MKENYYSSAAGREMTSETSEEVARRKLYFLAFDLWAWSFVDPETCLTVTPVKCSGCGLEYYEAVEVAIENVVCGVGHACISCDCDSLACSGVSFVRNMSG